MIYISDKQIKALMAARKREWSTVKRSYPKFKPGMTTASYIQQFAAYSGGAEVLTYDLSAYDRPAPELVGPEVEHEECYMPD